MYTGFSLQKEGSIPAESLTHQEYTSKRGERYEVKKHQDSNLFKGDDAAVLESSTGREFVPKQGERYEIKKPKESDIWKVSASKS